MTAKCNFKNIIEAFELPRYGIVEKILAQLIILFRVWWIMDIVQCTVI